MCWHRYTAVQLYGRFLAVWYLNDVEGPGGEAEYPFQDVKITPEAGKLLLFPPFCTHEHRGVTLEQGVKYIATACEAYKNRSLKKQPATINQIR
jgi:hypothetical protein